MRRFFELLKQKGSIAIIGILIGLFGGFRLANARYRSEQTRLRDVQATQAAANLGKEGNNAAGGGQMQNQTTAILNRARSNPNDIEAQLDAADQFLQIQRPQGALEFLQQANKLKPDDPRPMSALSTAYLMLGNYPEAIKWARAGLARKPDDLGTKVLLIFGYIEARQNLVEAEKLLAEVERQRPGDKILVDAREALEKAKTGNTANNAAPVADATSANQTAAPTSNKTMLEHGATSAPPQPK